MSSGVVPAVDVGGTTIKGALVDHELRIVDRLDRPTPVTGRPDSVIDAVCGVLTSLAPTSGPTAAGLVVPGIVDELTGRTVHSVNLGWHDLALREIVAQRTGLEIAFGHDVRAAALAEVAAGAARGASSAMYLSIGTGIAGAFAVDGGILVSGGYAGEVGHVTVDPAGSRCSCGGRGCLETIASAPAIAHRYVELSGHRVSGAADVRDRVQAGDDHARLVWDDAVRALAQVLATAVSLFAPEVIVIGGGVSGAGEALLRPLRREVTSRLTFQRVPRVVVGTFGAEAGCVGAALLARDLLLASG